MKSFRSFFGLAALAVMAAVACTAFTACGTGVGGADASASSPATSHFKADLAAGYDALATARVATKSALDSSKITVPQALAVENQCKALTATLDALRAAGDTSTSESAVQATLLAIQAATIFVTTSQGVPKS